MPDRVARLFRVRCANCEGTLLTVALLGGEDIASVEQHVRRCWERDPLPKHPALGEVMHLVRVSIVGIGSETPPRLH
jgi:hypothetical protein